jgi:sporulation integral membrane protein YlbJ
MLLYLWVTLTISLLLFFIVQARSWNKNRRSRALSVFLGGVGLFLVISLVLFPEDAFRASVKGLNIWWEVVFPASLPFFIASEILMGFGVVHFLGVLLEPLMRPIFRVPGTGAFVLAMGLSSGYPIGAKLTARLREQNLITRAEGERLVSFTNNANPLFLSGAVAVGFFHDVTLSFILMLTHYSSSLMVGFLMRFHDPYAGISIPAERTMDNILARAFRAMHRARLEDGRPAGKLMGDAVSSSVNTLLLVGGFIIMFSVIINILTIIQVTKFFSAAISVILLPFGVPELLFPSIISGFFEITLGAQLASMVPSTITMSWKIAVASGFLAWSGMSVHSQVASILSTTDIRYKPFMWAKLLQGVIAALLTLLLWEPVERWVASSSIPAFLMKAGDSAPLTYFGTSLNYFSMYIAIGAAALWIISTLNYKRHNQIRPRRR